MKTTALIEKGRDGTFCVFTPDLLHTIIGEGKTITDAKADFQNSVKEVIASYSEVEKPIPAELQGVKFEYKYSI